MEGKDVFAILFFCAGVANFFVEAKDVFAILFFRAGVANAGLDVYITVTFLCDGVTEPLVAPRALVAVAGAWPSKTGGTSVLPERTFFITFVINFGSL